MILLRFGVFFRFTCQGRKAPVAEWRVFGNKQAVPDVSANIFWRMSP